VRRLPRDHLTCRLGVVVEDGRLRLDFFGTDPQVSRYHNGTYATSYAKALATSVDATTRAAVVTGRRRNVRLNGSGKTSPSGFVPVDAATEDYGVSIPRRGAVVAGTASGAAASSP
jgi:hypothetical protein